ncbi:hypothetical protein HDV03_000811 [Kappamyces sp. JEL0829]|nr:hypothetical protein HDV03_000811 [Kappamyces sp. JEL0829]
MDVYHINTGYLLEKAFQKQTASGIQAKAFIDRGQLVPDHIVITLILQQLKDPEVAEKGYLLEGFPRTKNQALALCQAGFIPDHVLDVIIPDELVLHRSLGLRFDPVTGENFNLQEEAIARSADVDARLTVRPCDTPASVKERLNVYKRHHKAIVECFPGNYRRFSAGSVQDSNLVQEMLLFLGLKPVSKAPRGFRIIVAGLPGSGKTTVAEQISEKFGPVLVSPRKVILQAISAGVGEQFVPFLDNLNLAPQDLVAELVMNRLKQNDCQERGWVLDGFPVRHKDMLLFKEDEVYPNRVIWLASPQSACWSRLLYRRHDPSSARSINLKEIPDELAHADLSGWIHAPADWDASLESRFKDYEQTEKELKKAFGTKTSASYNGVFHSINANESNADVVFELVEAHLIRPVPLTIV